MGFTVGIENIGSFLPKIVRAHALFDQQGDMKSVLSALSPQQTSMTKPAAGHRQRLRDRFLAKEDRVLTEEVLLELLLTVQPLAHR